MIVKFIPGGKKLGEYLAEAIKNENVANQNGRKSVSTNTAKSTSQRHKAEEKAQSERDIEMPQEVKPKV